MAHAVCCLGLRWRLRAMACTALHERVSLVRDVHGVSFRDRARLMAHATLVHVRDDVFVAVNARVMADLVRRLCLWRRLRAVARAALHERVDVVRDIQRLGLHDRNRLVAHAALVHVGDDVFMTLDAGVMAHLVAAHDLRRPHGPMARAAAHEGMYVVRDVHGVCLAQLGTFVANHARILVADPAFVAVDARVMVHADGLSAIEPMHQACVASVAIDAHGIVQAVPV